MPFDYNALVESQLQGQLPPDVINEIAQRAAERGVATGSPGGPGANAAYLAAIGRSSLDLVGQGQKAYENQQQIALEQARLSEQAREFEANLTFEEKKLAQALGISNQEFAMEKAKLAEQERQFNVGAGETQREFDIGTGLKERQLGESEREFNLGYGLDTSRLGLEASRLGEQARQFNLGYGLDTSRLGLETSRLGEQQRQFNVGTGLDLSRLGEQRRQFNLGYNVDLSRLTPQQLSNLSYISPGTVPSYFRHGTVYPTSWTQANMFDDTTRFSPYGSNIWMAGGIPH